MNLNTNAVRDLLHAFEFTRLFRTELGWNRLVVSPVLITVDHEQYTCTPVAEQRGAQVYLCTKDVIPGVVLRHKIDNYLTRHARQHLLIFADTAQSRQVWQWAEHSPGQPHFLRSYEWHKGHAGGILTQRLAEIAIPISEEESIDLTSVTHRLKDAFDRDRVTKHFFELFEKQRQRFQGVVGGLPDAETTKWYSSVVVNRLMFIYFLQKQGFLDHGDRDYLRGRLESAKWKGSDHYYLDFLRPLFFEGFAKPERTAEVQQLLGDVPYLNGGLFSPHTIEERYGEKIRIPDVAFDKLLDFFDAYQWTLDDRPLGRDDEINPDVLGYIFEKYVNQRQMGAYYTKEDITGYISQGTVIPRLFDMVKSRYGRAFEGIGSVFSLLRDAPDTYIYASMRKGARDADGNKMDLPDKIARGINDVSERGDWNKSADEGFALPTEIWREVVARTQRYEEVRQRCANGDVNDINDLITYNLDIRQFAQDAIAESDDPVFVLEYYRALQTITVLDPTCGSGAFLFAALNILVRLYEVCLQRMEQFQQDGITHIGQALRAVEEFDEILREADKHSNRRYYMLKSIAVHNLYGVDIMEEAVEICKLRLFLRLVAELEPGQPIEPLPDIDFNIRAGNTLVGYAHFGDVKTSRSEEFFGKDRLPIIEQEAGNLARLYRKMQEQQMVIGGRVRPQDKLTLQQGRTHMVNELDNYLAYDYGIQSKNLKAHQEWRTKAQPFHWFAEFHDIVSNGGFDVVIGNPPYVEYSKVRDEYQVLGYETETCGNLYAFVLERSLGLLHGSGRVGYIVPLASLATQRMTPLRRACLAASRCSWLSNYEATSNPSILFVGVKIQLSIILLEQGSCVCPSVHVTRYMRCFADERSTLFERLEYCLLEDGVKCLETGYPKVSSARELPLVRCLSTSQHSLRDVVGRGKSHIYYRNMGNFFFKLAFLKRPLYEKNGIAQNSSTVSEVAMVDADAALCATACINSSFFYYSWLLLSDCYHTTLRDISRFPVSSRSLGDAQSTNLKVAASKLLQALESESTLQRESKKDGTQRLYQRFFPQKCKPLADQVDVIIGHALRLTAEQVDFVKNYDIKYRLGADDGDEPDDE
jgi:hypothetical protein